jgi:hypothetical protein
MNKSGDLLWEDRRMGFSRTTLTVLAIVGADVIVRIFFRETSGAFLIEGALMAIGIYFAFRFGKWDGASADLGGGSSACAHGGHS